MVYFKVNRKRTIRLNKISVEEFVKKGFGKKGDFYKALGQEEPKLTEKETLLLEAEKLKIEGFLDMSIKELKEAIKGAGL